MIKTFEQKLTKETKVGQISEYKLGDFSESVFLGLLRSLRSLLFKFFSSNSTELSSIFWVTFFEDESGGLRTPARLIEVTSD